MRLQHVSVDVVKTMGRGAHRFDRKMPTYPVCKNVCLASVLEHELVACLGCCSRLTTNSKVFWFGGAKLLDPPGVLASNGPQCAISHLLLSSSLSYSLFFLLLHAGTEAGL